MNTDETERALHTLKLPGMANCWTSLYETHRLDKLSLRDGMQLMLQSEKDMRESNHIARLVKLAGFRQKAVLEQLEVDTTRGISAASAAELGTCEYLRHGMTVVITGPAGTGKSYLAQALGERACRLGHRTMYYTMKRLAEAIKLARLEGREVNFFKKMANQDLLIIDDWGMSKLTGELQNDFEQIIDDRYHDKSLILCSQLPVADWYDIFQSELIAEACLSG